MQLQPKGPRQSLADAFTAMFSSMKEKMSMAESRMDILRLALNFCNMIDRGSIHIHMTDGMEMAGAHH